MRYRYFIKNINTSIISIRVTIKRCNYDFFNFQNTALFEQKWGGYPQNSLIFLGLTVNILCIWALKRE